MLIEYIKYVLNIEQSDTAQDKLIEYLLQSSKKKISSYCNIEYTDILDDYAVEVVVARYRRRGGEGTTSEGMGSLNKSYDGDIPESIKSQLNRFRRLR